MPPRGLTLEEIARHVLKSPVLRASNPAADNTTGARLMNLVITDAMTALGVNKNGRLTPQDARAIGHYIRTNAALYAVFTNAHDVYEKAGKSGSGITDPAAKAKETPLARKANTPRGGGPERHVFDGGAFADALEGWNSGSARDDFVFKF